MKLLLIIPLYIFILLPIFGQPPVLPNQIENLKRIIPSRTIQSTNASGFISYNNFTKLNATNDGVSAEGNINYVNKSYYNFSLNVTTPVTSKSQQVKPLTIAGLSNGSSITLGIQKIRWGVGFKYDPLQYNEAIRAIGKNIADFNYANLTEKEQWEFDQRSGIDWGKAFYFGAKIGIDQQSFEYISDISTLASLEESRTGIRASASLGMLTQNGIFAFTFTHKNGYQIAEPIKYYVPINANGVQVERNLSPSAPFEQNSNKVRFEYLSIGESSSLIRVNPNLNIEFNQEVYSFELPIYFLTSDANRANFNGGIFAGYVSDIGYELAFDKNNYGFGVFIGANFTNIFQ